MVNIHETNSLGSCIESLLTDKGRFLYSNDDGRLDTSSITVACLNGLQPKITKNTTDTTALKTPLNTINQSLFTHSLSKLCNEENDALRHVIVC